MFLSNLSIKRPVFAAVMMLALVTLGIASYLRLPVDLWPEVEIPVVTIVTPYPGASPEAVEREVSRRIEEAVNPIAGVKHVAATCRRASRIRSSRRSTSAALRSSRLPSVPRRFRRAT
jgi:HAE1 family hydrophobic/amphiphilic exporter-1